MPGEFIKEVHIFQCGQSSDGGAIMCSEITETRIPFTLPASADPRALGRQEAGATDIHIPLDNLFAALARFGITEEELTRRFRAAQSGEHPSSCWPACLPSMGSSVEDAWT
jgi:hypothetical protein